MARGAVTTTMPPSLPLAMPQVQTSGLVYPAAADPTGASFVEHRGEGTLATFLFEGRHRVGGKMVRKQVYFSSASVRDSPSERTIRPDEVTHPFVLSFLSHTLVALVGCACRNAPRQPGGVLLEAPLFTRRRLRHGEGLGNPSPTCVYT